MTALKTCKVKRVSLLLLTLIVSSLLIACEDEQKKKEKIMPAAKQGIHKEGSITFLPLSADEKGSAEYTESYGWLDNDTIIYTAKEKEIYSLYSFHISSKKKQELFSTSEIISSASVSPDRKYILVHSSGSNKNATIRILNPEGKTIQEISVPSTEINFSWNHYSDGKLLLESFNDNWEHATYLFDILEGTRVRMDVPAPFAEWSSENSLVFLDWNGEDMQLSAPLKQYDLKEGTVEVLEDRVFSFGIMGGTLFVVREAGEPGGQQEIEYAFYDRKLKKLSSFRSPAGGSDPDWIVPSFDFVAEQNAFYTFSLPDSGPQNYQLIKYDVRQGKKTMIMDDVEEAPLECSPDANRCLYGGRLEMLIE